MDDHASDMHLINAAPFRVVVEHMIAAALRLMESAAPLRKQCTAITKMLKAYRLLIVIEGYNRDKLLRANMLSNPSWCQRVFFQLGGQEAAQRWRHRRRTAREAQWQPRNTPRKTSKPHGPAASRANPSRRYKTDERGQFRFAPIERGPNDFIRGNEQAASTPVHTSAAVLMKPIPIYPHEFEAALRAHGAGESGASSGSGSACQSGYGNSSGGFTAMPPDHISSSKPFGAPCHKSGAAPPL